jgi:hypothetical protein
MTTEINEPRHAPGVVIRAAGTDSDWFKHLRRFHSSQIFTDASEAASATAKDRERKVWRFSMLETCVVRTLQRLREHGFSTAEAVTFVPELRDQLRILLSHQDEASHLVGFFRLGGTPALLKFFPNDDVMTLLARIQSAGVVTIIDLDAITDEVQHALEQIEKWS